MRLATWNINSVRLRLTNLLRFMHEFKPDVISLQETKTENVTFPVKQIEEAGYSYIAIDGNKGYNGVAILSKLPLENIQIQNWCGKKDARHISGIVKGDIEIHNLYVPAGGDIPNPEQNPKFAHKLEFVDALTSFFSSRKTDQKRMILVGDLNIAPLETDVWSHKQLLDVVSHTPIEVELLTKFQNESQWVDAVRHMIPPEKKLYTWWSYRAQDWRKSDRGRRLDHIWVSQPLKPSIHKAEVLKEIRGWDLPSDHVPIILDLDL